MASARIEVFSDREIIAIVHDLADDEGWVSTHDMTDRLFGSVNKHRMRCTATRMGRMRSMGLFEKDRKRGQTNWRLTHDAQMFANGKLRQALKDRLENASEAELLAAMTSMGERYRGGSLLGATLLRREWQHWR